MSIHVFAGPTLGLDEISRQLESAHVHGPVRHGDLLRLNLGEGDIALLIDGLYHHHPPIRHKEILEVMANGATVAGAASMGALRAAELWQYGMIGIGRVFRMYADGLIDSDDEVAVVHTPGPECRLLSIALVDIRHCLSNCTDEGVLNESDADELLLVARELPYPRRSWRMIERVAAQRHSRLASAFEKMSSFLAQHPEIGNLKLSDAMLAIDHVRNGSLSKRRPAPAEWRHSAEWRTVHLRRWIGEFTGVEVSGVHVGHAAVLRYQQIYDPEFPERWERFTLERIADSDGLTTRTHCELRDRALAAARSKNVTFRNLTAEQRNEWLTPTENNNYSESEAMTRILVRATRISLDFSRPDLYEKILLRSPDDTRSHIAEAVAINDRLSTDNFAAHIDNLRADKLRSHLAQTWGMAPDVDDRQLTAAARDRGMATLDEAIEAVRPFFLHSHVTARRAERETRV